MAVVASLCYLPLRAQPAEGTAGLCAACGSLWAPQGAGTACCTGGDPFPSPGLGVLAGLVSQADGSPWCEGSLAEFGCQAPNWGWVTVMGRGVGFGLAGFSFLEACLMISALEHFSGMWKCFSM